MRKKMEHLKEQRRKFTAIFVRYGRKNGWKGRSETTLLFNDIIDVKTNKKVTGHIWFNLGKRFATLNLKEGEKISFDARVTEYLKGYRGHRDVHRYVERDLRLSNPTNIIKIGGNKECCCLNHIMLS